MPKVTGGSAPRDNSSARSGALLAFLAIVLIVVVVVIRGNMEAGLLPGEGQLRYRLMPPKFLGTWSGETNRGQGWLVQYNLNGSARVITADGGVDGVTNAKSASANEFNWTIEDHYIVMINTNPDAHPDKISTLAINLGDKFMLVARIEKAGNPVEIPLKPFPADKFDTLYDQDKSASK